MIYRAVFFIILFLLTSCGGSEKNKKNNSDNNPPVISQTDEDISNDKQPRITSKYSLWKMKIGSDTLTVKSFGSCVGDDGCNFEDYMLVAYKDRKIFVNRKFPESINFRDKNLVATGITVVKNWEVDEDTFLNYENIFVQKLKDLPSDANKMEINEVFDIDQYKIVKATEHYLQTRRCAQSYLIQNFKKECPLDDGNMNLTNGSMDILSSMSLGIFTAIQYDLPNDQIVSVGTFFSSTLSQSLSHKIGRGFNTYFSTVNYQINDDIYYFNAIDPQRTTSLAVLNHACANLYEVKAYGRFISGVSRSYNRAVNLDWEEELSEKLVEDLQIISQEWKYAGYSKREHITDLYTFLTEFPDLFYSEKYMEQKLYLGEACEKYFLNQ